MAEGAAGSAGRTQGETPFALTPRCIVTVRADGLQLQGPIHAPPFYIGLPELEIIAVIDAEPAVSLEQVVLDVAQRTNREPKELNDFVRKMRFAKQLVAGESQTRRDLPDRPAVATTTSFDLDGPQLVALRVPQVLRLHKGQFEIVDHDGRRVAVLAPAEVVALGTLIRPVSAREALATARASLPEDALDERRFAELLGRLDDAGLIRTTDTGTASAPVAPTVDRDVRRPRGIRPSRRGAGVLPNASASSEPERGARRSSQSRSTWARRPASGWSIACAKAFDDGRARGALQLPHRLGVERRSTRGVHRRTVRSTSSRTTCGRTSAASRSPKRSRQRNPASITIHGGPDTPKYEGDARGVLRRPPARRHHDSR